MPDIIDVSDSLNKLVGKVRSPPAETVPVVEQALSRSLTKSRELPEVLTIGEVLDRTLAKTRPLTTETVTIGESLNTTIRRSVSRSITETVDISDNTDYDQAKGRAILTESTTIEEELKGYLNDVEFAPPAEVLTPSSLISGTRERAVRIPRRQPRPIVLEADLTANKIIAPLKVLAFAEASNRIQTPLGLRTQPSLALSRIRVPLTRLQSAKSQLYTSPQIQPIKCRLRVLSTDVLTLKHQTARAHIRLSQEYQAIESLRPIDAVKIDRMTKLATLLMLVDSL